MTVDDAAWFTGRLSGGAVASSRRPATRPGARTRFRFEISGSRGAVVFDLETMNELEFYDGDGRRRASRDSAASSSTEPEHPYAANWWPTGHALGYEHAFSHQVVDLVIDIVEGRAARAVVRRRAPGAARAPPSSAGRNGIWPASPRALTSRIEHPPHRRAFTEEGEHG